MNDESIFNSAVILNVFGLRAGPLSSALPDPAPEGRLLFWLQIIETQQPDV
jgi:hypothetical protein